MGRRLLPMLLVLVAAAADASGGHGLARDALLAALPFAAVEAIAACGEVVDRRPRAEASMQALLSSLAVALIVVSSALRSDAAPGVPRPAELAAVAALALLGLKGGIALRPRLQRLAGLWPAKP